MSVITSNRIRLLSLTLGASLGVGLLYLFVSGQQDSIKFEELALGAETKLALAHVDSIPIHCRDLDDAQHCLDGYRTSGQGWDVVLWLGNSQVHAINQIKPGDETAAPELHHELQDKDVYFLTFSQPNANLQEHYVLFHYLLDQLPLRSLVLPVVFDDMRNTGIRSSLTDVMSEPAVIERLGDTQIGRRQLADHGDQDTAGNDMAALDDTIQEKSEKYLNQKLSEVWPVWAARPDLRGELFLYLYQLRNWMLGINPSSTRKMLPGRYALNKQALEAILDEARWRSIDVLVYIVPLRSDVKVPYDLGEYQSFKDEIQDIALAKGARFANLETLVPANLWGTKDETTAGGGQELDFMHFQAGGHRLLAGALYRELMVHWGEDGDYPQ
jgi:hypothetical protein